MKNTKILLTILTLSMLATPCLTFTNGDQDQDVLTKFGSFWEKSDTKTKTITGIGIGLGSIFTLWASTKILKFVPTICKFLIPVVGLGGGYLYIKNQANKPGNEKYKSIIDTIEEFTYNTFNSTKNWFGNLFSSEEKSETKLKEPLTV